ncbi:hypothetical protein [Amantichitinum ursilacus]|uniref:Uncharacterized protein n=1 Tax=Amantichitinum ursilacus TaxID=857265 RepID=A0A0N0XM33_9NEIS|nr:hypothetical protein [Amantichitinum ursilacus]KPC53847.1 hypothetical protein WG78_06980 [Amantichitinum ursilacus]
MFKRFLFCFVLMAVSSISNANGTVDFQTDIIPLINQKPFFAKFLTDHLEFYPAGDAITIGREVNPNLALVRIGPYTLNAREKGSKGL